MFYKFVLIAIGISLFGSDASGKSYRILLVGSLRNAAHSSGGFLSYTFDDISKTLHFEHQCPYLEGMQEYGTSLSIDGKTTECIMLKKSREFCVVGIYDSWRGGIKKVLLKQHGETNYRRMYFPEVQNVLSVSGPSGVQTIYSDSIPGPAILDSKTNLWFAQGDDVWGKALRDPNREPMRLSGPHRNPYLGVDGTIKTIGFGSRLDAVAPLESFPYASIRSPIEICDGVLAVTFSPDKGKPSRFYLGIVDVASGKLIAVSECGRVFSLLKIRTTAN